MKHRINSKLLELLLIALITGTFFVPRLGTDSASALSSPSHPNASSAECAIPVGIFVTSIYAVDFQAEKYTIVFWLWSTYPTEAMKQIAGEDYVPFNKIEIVNAQNKIISATDQYVIENADGTTYTIAKFTATVIQHWDVRNFPFDRQNLNLVIESVGLPSNVISFVPDTENSMISEELKLSGWNVGNLQLDALDYTYQSTFGDPSQQLGVYPRIVASIPIHRIGFRLFINAFLGFFISFLIVALLYLLHVDSRLGLIMTALFAAVGNKYTIDTYFPNQPAFSLSDLIQICTFGMIAVGLISTVISLRLVKAGNENSSQILDRLALTLIVPAYILIVGIGTFLAIRG